jgi:hypothetical protein
VAALVGGQRLEDRLVLPEADYIADLFTIADQFWTHNVLAGNPPDISSLDLLVEHLSRLAPEKGVPVPLEVAEQREVVHLARLIREAEQHEKAAGDAEQRLKALIGDAGTDIVIDGVPWFTWRPQAKAKYLDKDALDGCLRAAGLPSLATWYVKPEETTRVLRKAAGYKALVDTELEAEAESEVG